MIIFTKTFCGTGMRLIVCGVLFSVVTVRRCKFFDIFGIIFGIFCIFFRFSFDNVVYIFDAVVVVVVVVAYFVTVVKKVTKKEYILSKITKMFTALKNSYLYTT